MPKKSIWDSSIVKAIAALAALVTVVGFVLQYFGKVDFWNNLFVPVINFFNFPVPLYSIPLAFLVVIGGFLLVLYIDDKLHPTPASSNIPNPLAGAEVLDNPLARGMAILCKTPRTPDFLKQKYRELWSELGILRAVSCEDCLKDMEDRGLIVFQNGTWEATQKALDYIAKYHGGK
jgi:hypothetical protein